MLSFFAFCVVKGCFYYVRVPMRGRWLQGWLRQSP